MTKRSQHTTDQRTRGRALQRIRAEHFARNPLCVHCEAEGKVTPWTELDHIVPLSQGGEDTDDNRQGLCSACHEAKTMKDLGHHERTQFDEKGRVQW